MSDFPKQVIENIFPEEKNHVISWAKLQKQNLRAWIFALVVIGLCYLGLNYQIVILYLSTNAQFVFDCVIFGWILAIIALPFVWLQKPEDTFVDNFRSGVNPRIWEYEGNWKTELDERGKPVLTVTDSELGGLVVPCRAWTDYEFQFETRIIKECTAWIVRASNLNDCIMFQLRHDLFRPHIRANGIWLKPENIKHGLPIKPNVWYSIRTLVRSSYATVYATVNGKEQMVYQDKIFGTHPAMTVDLRPLVNQAPDIMAAQVVNVSVRVGSFGFRLSGNETAQFRNVRAYRLR